jgi:structural maintenance of chromosome 4
LEAEIGQGEQQIQVLAGTIRSTRAQIQQARSTKEQASTSSKLLSSLMAYARKHPTLNLKGRLGDLGTIDSKYDVAITTACGSLDNIVVESTEDAQICVEFLKYVLALLLDGNHVLTLSFSLSDCARVRA